MKDEKKLTAVDIFFIHAIQIVDGTENKETLFANYMDAKMVEMEQIKDAYYIGYDDAGTSPFAKGDDYYHNTYKR